jgi:TolA-binding protein
MNVQSMSGRGLQAAALVAGALLGMSLAAQGAHVTMPDGRTIEGTNIRITSQGDVILTTPQGQQTFPKGQYLKAVADKPPEFDQARALAGQKKFDESIAMFKSIALQNKGLDWDLKALAAVGQIQAAKGDAAGAVATFEQIFKDSPEARTDATVGWAYRGALLAAKMYPKLSADLDELVAKGSRSDAAKAQVMRGDIRMAQNQVEGAVMDYLRSAILFENETEVQPEAIFKAAEGLEKLKDPRAKEMYRKLVQNYPDSPYAQKAKTKT